MDDVTERLREAYEAGGYDVENVSRNRAQVRVVLREEGAEAEELRSIATEVVEGDDDVLGLDVTSESAGDGAYMTTVVTFRYRPS